MPQLQKIDPDNLRDTLVEVRYEASFDFSVLKGLLFQAFKDYGDVLNVNPISVQLGKNMPLLLPTDSSLDFVVESVKFSFSAQRVHFNTVGRYPGWNAYVPVIAHVLEKMVDLNFIVSTHQIGLRYISDHPGQLIKEITNLSYMIPNIGDQREQNMFRFDTTLGEDRLSLSLSDIYVTNAEGDQTEQAVIDIDVIHLNTSNSTTKGDYLQILERLHDKEKSTFVKIMRASYLHALKAEFQ